MDGFAAHRSRAPWATTPRTTCPSTTRWPRRSRLANRWFCSAPAQTYPNRRFYMAGTASGIIVDGHRRTSAMYPANGTIWDQLSKHGISWKNYFSDAPDDGHHPRHHLRAPAQPRPHRRVLSPTPRPGTLPAVSLVDCNMGAIQGEIPSVIGMLPAPIPTFAGDAGPGHRDDVPVRGEPRGRPARRAVRGVGRQRRDVGPRLAPDPVGLALRRARRLLRPRAAAGGHRARRHRPRHRPGRPARRATTSTAPGSPWWW